MKCKQALPRVSRYQQDGFYLDLTYVTNRVIATSFPSTGLWSLYRFVDYGDNLDLCNMKILFVNSRPLPPILHRNPIEKVSAFLDAKHKDRFLELIMNMEQSYFCMFSPLPSLRYMMFNLCSEKTYDTSFFHGRVERVLIDDHNVPSLQQMLEFANKVPDDGTKNMEY